MEDEFENLTKYYYSTNEVAEIIGVEASTLRFWDKEFSSFPEYCASRGNSSNHRKYTKENIKNIKKLKHLLHEKGMTIEGAKKHIKASKKGDKKNLDLIMKLKEIRNELEKMKDMLDKFSPNN